MNHLLRPVRNLMFLILRIATRLYISNKRFIHRPASEGIALGLSIGLQNFELMFTEAG